MYFVEQPDHIVTVSCSTNIVSSHVHVISYLESTHLIQT